MRSSAEVPTAPELAVVASPRGGAYLGGRTDVELDGVSERASALHINPGGSFDEASHVLDTYEGLTYRETTPSAPPADGRLATIGRFEPTIPTT